MTYTNTFNLRKYAGLSLSLLAVGLLVSYIAFVHAAIVVSVESGQLREKSQLMQSELSRADKEYLTSIRQLMTLDEAQTRLLKSREVYSMSTQLQNGVSIRLHDYVGGR
jgi:hypothetical protein